MENIKKKFIDQQVEEMTNGQELGGMINRHKKVLELALKHSQPDDKILDVGCFDGKVLKALEQMGYKNLYGVDFSEVAEKSFKNTKIHFATFDIEKDELPFKEKFDLVIYADVLEHLFSPQATLFDIKRSLKPEGKIVISVPNAGWFLNGILLTFFPSKLFVSPAFGPWGHTYNFTVFQLRKIASELDYEVVELMGGRMHNHVFKSGWKKFIFDVFTILTYSLAIQWPAVWSSHLYAVIKNTPKKASLAKRIDVGA